MITRGLRELRVTDDGQTLIVTNFSSDTVEFVDIGRLSRGWSKPANRWRSPRRGARLTPRHHGRSLP